MIVHISSYVPHSIFEHDRTCKMKEKWKLFHRVKRGKCEGVTILLIIFSKLMNLTPDSEVLFRLITCLCRSDTYLRLVASGSSKIKSNWKTSAFSERSMTLQMTRGAGRVDISWTDLGHLILNLFCDFQQLFLHITWLLWAEWYGF